MTRNVVAIITSEAVCSHIRRGEHDCIEAIERNQPTDEIYATELKFHTVTQHNPTSQRPPTRQSISNPAVVLQIQMYVILKTLYYTNPAQCQTHTS
jgi:hypothetical protein